MNKIIRFTCSSGRIILFFICAFLIVYAGFRPIGIDPDSQNYADLFEQAGDAFEFSDKEPLFWLILFSVRDFLFLDVRYFLLIFAFLGVGIKLYAIVRLSINICFGGVLLHSSLFFLHEFTQIRAGIASGLFLLSLGDLVAKNKSRFVMKNVIAVGFHYTGLVGFFVLLLKPNKFNRLFYFSLPVIGLIVSQIPVFDVAAQFVPGFLGQKIQIYTQLFEEGWGVEIKLFNPALVFYLTVYYIAVSLSSFLKTELNFVLVKVLGFSLFAFYALSTLPVFAFRVSEYLGIVIVVLLPNMARMFREKAIYYAIVVLCLMPIFFAVSISKILMAGVV